VLFCACVVPPHWFVLLAAFYCIVISVRHCDASVVRTSAAMQLHSPRGARRFR
jgi:hypothetical protein